LLDPKLLEILVCPVCKGDLKVQEALSALDCLNCRLRYKVENGIPIMLQDEAAAIGDGDAAK
jgi:uncharacterized protein